MWSMETHLLIHVIAKITYARGRLPLSEEQTFLILVVFTVYFVCVCFCNVIFVKILEKLYSSIMPIKFLI